MTQELRRLAEEEHEAMFYDRVSSGSKKYAELTKPAAILELLDRLEKAEKDAQLTRIQKECLRIGEEIQRAAGYLPEFYELEVYVERGYGCVYLRNPDGEHATFSDTVDGLSHCITQAIDAAMEASK